MKVSSAIVTCEAEYVQIAMSPTLVAPMPLYDCHRSGSRKIRPRVDWQDQRINLELVCGHVTNGCPLIAS